MPVNNRKGVVHLLPLLLIAIISGILLYSFSSFDKGTIKDFGNGVLAKINSRGGGKGKPALTPSPTPITVEVPIVDGIPEGTTGTNVLPNSSFEIDDDQDKIPDEWTWQPGKLRKNKGEGLICNSSSDGLCSFRIVAFGSQQRVLRIDIPVVPVTINHVRATVDSKPLNASANFLSVNFGTTGGSFAGGPLLILPSGTTNDFVTTSRSVNYAQPQVVNRITVLMGFDGPNGSIDFDNVKLELFE
jgi:hypothetical protein